MALTIHTTSDKKSSLEEYLETISKIDLADIDQVLESSEKLKELSNNKNFLIDKLNQELMDFGKFQSHNTYSAQTLTLGGGKNYAVRANMWLPRENNEPNSTESWENKLYAYSLPHDHNFSFLTVGYWGSGYNTTIYEYDSEKIIGYPTEKVDIRFLEETTLPEGKVMFYRASKDIHTQEEPKDFSISLNLLIISPEVHIKNQYWFDLKDSSIKNYVQTSSRSRLIICNLAKCIHNDKTISILEELARNHINPNVRYNALDSLAYILPEESLGLWKRGLEDPSTYVKHMSKNFVSRLGNVIEKI